MKSINDHGHSHHIPSTSNGVLNGMMVEMKEMGHPDNGMTKGVMVETMERGRGWTTSTKNEDYNLVVIHAANSGYVAKMASDKGSYLIQLFVDVMRQNIEKKKRMKLDAVFEYIQNTLHDEGKQQIVHVFNNDTRNLQLKVNHN